MQNSERLFYAVLETEGGWMGLLANDRGLVKTTLPQKSREEAELSLETGDEAIYSEDKFKRTNEQLQKYFKGQKVEFELELELSGYTQFERAVWEATRKIHYGEITSYGTIARNIGKPGAARAVGQALGRNPIPIIIPCHRVLTHDGRLGGFGGGLEMKSYLLKLESGHL